MKNNWEIIDKKGVIHSGTEEEMRTAFDIMTRGVYDVSEQDELQYGQYLTTWEGDLKLIEVHKLSI